LAKCSFCGPLKKSRQFAGQDAAREHALIDDLLLVGVVNSI